MPKKILLADDSVTIQKVVELTFAEGDYEVTCVSNGRAAVERLKAVRPDILLCDIIMPELSGYEVAEFVKRDPAFKGIPVILLTGTFEPFDEDKARLSGADTYITKPFDSRMLVEKVESLLQQRLVMTTAPHTQVMELLPGQGQSMTVQPPPPPVEAVQAKLDQLSESQSSPFQESPLPQTAPSPFAANSPGAFSEVALPTIAPLTAAGGGAFGSADASPFETPAPPPAPPVAPPEPASQPFTQPLAVVPAPAPPTPSVMDFGDFQPTSPEEPAYQTAALEESATSSQPPLPPAVVPENPVSVEPESPAWSPLGEVPPAVPFASAGPMFSEEAPEVPPAPVRVMGARPEAAPVAGAFQEPELPPFAGEESAGPVETESSPALPPFVEQEGPEPELESAAWAGAPLTAADVAPVEGLVHEMTDQQGMVAEAQVFQQTTMEAEDDSVASIEPSPTQEAFSETASEPEAAWKEEDLGGEEPAVAPVVAATVAPSVPSAAAAPQVELAQIEEIVRKVIAEMAPDLVRQVAWEVIPELAESLIKRRIQELESQVE